MHGIVEPDLVATAREKQDSALAAYQLAKSREQRVAEKRGQGDTGVPLIVDRGDTELRDAIDADMTAQAALSAALRADDD